MSRKETRVGYRCNSTSGSSRGVGPEEICIYDNPFTSYYPVDGQHAEHFRCLRRKPGLFFYVKDSFCPLRRGCILVICCVFAMIFIAMLLSVTEFCSIRKSTPKYCLTQECVKTAAFLLTGMDQSVDPCDDFFHYACGMWNRIHVIPEDRSSITSFEILSDQLERVLRRLLDEPISSRDNSATEKVKKIYKTCINTTEIKLNGENQMKEIVASFGGWPIADQDWTETMAPAMETLCGRAMRQLNDALIFDLWVGPDDTNSSSNIIQMDQVSLGLPSRDYYLNSTDSIMRAYHEFMTTVATLYGAEEKFAGEEMRKVLDFEILLARISLPETKRIDTSEIYRKLTLRELQKKVPQIDWEEFLRNVLQSSVSQEEPIVFYALPYFIELGKQLSKTEKRVVQNYIIWKLLLNNFIPHLTGPYQQTRLAFKKVLFGISSERNRWVHCVDWTNRKLGMVVGAMFIRDNFNLDSKESATEIIKNIREAFNELLDENEWMDEKTKHLAKQKADAINERIGYPDILTKPRELEEEYRQLNVSENHFFLNVYNVLQFDSVKSIERLRKPVNRDRWTTEPAIVNAFYSPNQNDIVFPAGILQPFFYSKYFPKSINYGGIGVVIGHEITHGFDDKGRLFDKDGNMKEWWNNATIQAFKKQTQCIVDQYSAYHIDEIGMYLNGYITQGENIADNGGLKQAFRAYQKYVKRHGDEPLLPGLNLTNEQLFFLNYAQIWCGSMRPEDALAKIRTSAHPPGRLRVIGPLSNSNEFAKAFSCAPGTHMNPTKKCTVW